MPLETHGPAPIANAPGSRGAGWPWRRQVLDSGAGLDRASCSATSAPARSMRCKTALGQFKDGGVRRRAGGRHGLADRLGAADRRHRQIRAVPDAGRQQGRGRHPFARRARPHGARQADRRGVPARRRRRGAVLRRRHHHAGDLGAFGAGGPEAGQRRAVAPSCCRRRWSFSSRCSSPRAAARRAWRRSSGRSCWCSSRSTPCSALMQIPHAWVILKALSPLPGVRFLGAHGAIGLHRARQRVPRRHRRRSALRRHGPFRPPADPGRLAVRRAAGADLQLSRPGRADPRRPQGGGEPVLSAGARPGRWCR